MLYEPRVLRPAIQAAFDQGGLDAVCDFVVALLNEQEARHQAEMAAMEARHKAVVAKLDLTNRLALRMTMAGKLLQSVAAWLTPKRGESTESPLRPACFVHADELDWYSHFCRNCEVRAECGRGSEIQTSE